MDSITHRFADLSFDTPSTRSVSSSTTTRPSSVDMTSLFSVKRASVLETPPYRSRNRPCMPSDDEDDENDDDTSSDDDDDDPILIKRPAYPLLALPTKPLPATHRRTSQGYDEDGHALFESQRSGVGQGRRREMDDDDDEDNRIIGDPARRFGKQQTNTSNYAHIQMHAQPHRNPYPSQPYPCHPNMARTNLSGMDLLLQREQARAEMLQRQPRNKKLNPSHAKIEGLLARLPEPGAHTISFQQTMPQHALPHDRCHSRPTPMARASHPQYGKRSPMVVPSPAPRPSSCSNMHPPSWPAHAHPSSTHAPTPMTRPHTPLSHHDGASVRANNPSWVDGRSSPSRNAVHFMHMSSAKKNRNSGSGGSRLIISQ